MGNVGGGPRGRAGAGDVSRPSRGCLSQCPATMVPEVQRESFLFFVPVTNGEGGSRPRTEVAVAVNSPTSTIRECREHCPARTPGMVTNIARQTSQGICRRTHRPSELTGRAGHGARRGGLARAARPPRRFRGRNLTRPSRGVPSGKTPEWACTGRYHGHGAKAWDAVAARVRRAAEACDAVGGFLVVQSLAGGTGSGVGVPGPLTPCVGIVSW